MDHHVPLLSTQPMWYRYADYCYTKLKEDQVQTTLGHLKLVEPHINFIFETPGTDDRILFLDTKPAPDEGNSISFSMLEAYTQTST